MVELNIAFDSHVINGINICSESKYSSFEILTINDITSYGAINGIKNSRDSKFGYTYLPSKSIGDIDISTGLNIESPNITTCTFRFIT